MKALFVAEKPDLMRKVQDAYNKHKSEIPMTIDFAAQRGHLLSLKLPNEIDPAQAEWKWENLPFHPEDHGGWQYKITKEKKEGNFLTSEERFKEIKEAYKSGNYDIFIHAGDPDQEGELLLWETITAIGVDIPVKRFWTNALDEGSVVKALKNLKDESTDQMLINLKAAAYCRQHSDYRFGMNLSEAASLKMNGRAALGRVKTPILSIVCQREEDIKNFKPSTSYGVKAEYNAGFTGQLYKDEPGETDDENAEKGMIYFDTKQEAEDLIKTLSSPVTVVDYKTNRVNTTAPKLFKLATAQVACGKLGFTPDKTLEIIQSLYEKTYLSYPRTDCECISSHEDLDAMIKSASGVPSLKPFTDCIKQEDIQRVLGTKKYVNDKELESHGHSGLVPTVNPAPFNDLTEDEKKVYECVCRQFVAIFLPPLVQDKVVLITEYDGNTFKSNGKTLVSPGYSEIFGTTFKDVEIPVYNKGDKIDVLQYSLCENTTTCPKHLTQTDLIAICENPKKYLTDERLKNITKQLVIGTSATRAQIIKQLIVKDSYLKLEKENRTEYVLPTDNGVTIWKNLRDCLICKVDMTAQWDEMLEKVRTGEMKSDDFEKEMIQTVNHLIEDIRSKDMQSMSGSKFETVCKCPSCGGDILSGAKGYFCSNYKEKNCSTGAPKILVGARISENDIKKLFSGEMITKTLSKDDKKWEQKLRFDPAEKKIVFVKAEKKESSHKCPKCGSAMTENDKGLFCADESCKFAFWKSFGGHTLTEDEINTLLSGKETKPVSLTSQKGSKYRAKLVFDKSEYRVKPVFD